jgi:hypothetical protein
MEMHLQPSKIIAKRELADGVANHLASVVRAAFFYAVRATCIP